MNSYPNLKSNEVALLFCEVATGHVLDTHYELRISDIQEVYLVFENLNAAFDFAKKTVKERPDIECNIYGEKQDFLKRISIYNL